MSNSQSKFIDTIQDIVCQVLHNEGLMKDEWHLGVVTQVISPYSLSVKVNGSSNSQTIPCNPNVNFFVDDNVFVHYVNGNSANKFVPFKRATGTEPTGKTWIVNVKDFGAKGDGNSDDTVAIQNAINSSQKGSLIYFPVGTYMISATLHFKSNRTYEGVGWNTVIKQMDSKNIVQMVDMGDTNAHNQVQIKDMVFDGNKANNPSNTVGLYLYGVTNSIFTRVLVRNCIGTGFFIDGGTNAVSVTNHFNDCWSQSNGGYGFYTSANVQDLHILGGDFGGNSSSAIYLYSPSTSVRDAVLWGTLSGSGLVLNGVSCQVTGCNIEGHAGHGIQVNASHQFISGNKIYDNANVSSAYGQYDGVYVNGTSGANVENVVIVGNDIYAGLYASTGYYRYAVNLDTYHANCVVSDNSIRYAKSNGVVDDNDLAINGITTGDTYDGVLMVTTSFRPKTFPVGKNAYDTTLSKPVWYKGSGVWTDATGATV